MSNTGINISQLLYFSESVLKAFPIEENVKKLRTLADSEGNGEVNVLAIINDMNWLIEQAYFDKNKVNHERQESGY